MRSCKYLSVVQIFSGQNLGLPLGSSSLDLKVIEQTIHSFLLFLEKMSTRSHHCWLMNTTQALGSSHQRPQLTQQNTQIVWAHGFGNNEMLQRVREWVIVKTQSGVPWKECLMWFWLENSSRKLNRVTLYLCLEKVFPMGQGFASDYVSDSGGKCGNVGGLKRFFLHQQKNAVSIETWLSALCEWGQVIEQDRPLQYLPNDSHDCLLFRVSSLREKKQPVACS